MINKNSLVTLILVSLKAVVVVSNFEVYQKSQMIGKTS
jgi:hypothetical protein